MTRCSRRSQVCGVDSDRHARLAGLYSKFLAIGMFRLLELVGAKDPKALESVAKSVGLRPEAVNRDLLTYKVRNPSMLASSRVVCAGLAHCSDSLSLFGTASYLHTKSYTTPA